MQQDEIVKLTDVINELSNKAKIDKEIANEKIQVQ